MCKIFISLKHRIAKKVVQIKFPLYKLLSFGIRAFKINSSKAIKIKAYNTQIRNKSKKLYLKMWNNACYLKNKYDKI